MLKERPLPPSRVLGLLLALALAAAAAFAPSASANSGALTTTFDSNNQFAGNTFDLEVLHPGGVVVDSLDVNVLNLDATGTVEVWTRPGTAVGFESSMDGWTSQGSVEVTSAGLDNPTPVPISFSLPHGSYGVAVGVTDYPSLAMRYTNGAQNFENSVLKFIAGSGLANPVLDGGTVFTPRTWNGTIHYSKPSQECRDLKADKRKAKKKYKKAQKKAKKKKRKYKKAKASGDQSKAKKKKRQYKKAKKKAKKKKRKFKKAKKAYRQACK